MNIYKGCGTCGEEWGFGEPPTCKCKDRVTPVPKREWQGLTDEEITDAYAGGMLIFAKDPNKAFARAIEAKLKEKNT